MDTKKPLSNIIFVDDDPTSNYIHNLVIKKLEIKVNTYFFLNVDDAFNFLLNRELQENVIANDIIFIDINMPVKDGWDFIQELEENVAKNEQKKIIIMMSSVINKNDADRIKEHTMIDDFMLKPFSEEMLKKIFNKHILL